MMRKKWCSSCDHVRMEKLLLIIIIIVYMGFGWDDTVHADFFFHAGHILFFLFQMRMRMMMLCSQQEIDK